MNPPCGVVNEDSVKLVWPGAANRFTFAPPEIPPFNTNASSAFISIEHVVCGRSDPYVTDHDKEDELVCAGKLVVTAGALRIDHYGHHLNSASKEYLFQKKAESQI